MPKVIILGSSNAVPTLNHENTHLVIVGEERTILVDCVSTPVVRLEQAGVDFDLLTDIVIWIASLLFINLFRGGKTYELQPLLLLLLSIVPFQLFFMSVGLVISLLVKRVRHIMFLITNVLNAECVMKPVALKRSTLINIIEFL